MKFKEFQKEVKRTLPDLGNVYFNDPTENHLQGGTLPKEILNLLHTRLGIVSEISELITAITNKDKVNAGEELGDMLWYVANDLNICLKAEFINQEEYNKLANYNFNHFFQATNGGTGNTLNIWLNCITYNSCELADYVKKYLAYQKPMDKVKYLKSVEYLLGAINNVAATLGIEITEYMDKIIAKLMKRYPEKFNSEQAINRDTDAERIILEGSAGDPGIDSQDN